MALDIEFRNALRKAIKYNCKEIMGRKPSSQAKAKWKFENSADWHYGHFVGMVESLATSTFFTFFRSRPNEDQMDEIVEIIEEESKVLREYFKENFKNKSSLLNHNYSLQHTEPTIGADVINAHIMPSQIVCNVIKSSGLCYNNTCM